MVDRKTKRIVFFMAILLLLLVARLVLISDPDKEPLNVENEVESIGRDTFFYESKSPKESRPPYEDLYPDLYAAGGDLPTSLPEKEKIVYLTFDDGPSARTEDVLKTLKKEGVHATFFVVGQDLSDTRKELLKRIVEDGHTLGLHTYSHQYDKIYASIDSYLKDFNSVYTAVMEATGNRPNLFRFPGGSNNSFMKKIRKPLVEEMERRGFTFFDWNVSAEDAVGKPTKGSIRRNVLDALRLSYPVVLMHDGQANALTASVLPELIDTLKKAGYRFDTLNHRIPLQF